MNEQHFLPQKGNYKTLLSYQKSVIIYDCTYLFCQRFLNPRDRTVDQMIQAARSGKQNILEGSQAAVTSSETELKLTNVARASLEEVLEDYYDYLRTRELSVWKKDSKEASYIRKLASGKIKPPVIKENKKRHGSHISHKSHDLKILTENQQLQKVFIHFLKTRPPEICANILICLIHQCNYLLNRQIKQQENTFLQHGGIREQMFQARKEYRKADNNSCKQE